MADRIPTVHWANPEEWKVLVNARCQRNFKCTLEEFIDGWVLGSYDIGGPQHGALIETVSLFAKGQITAARKTLPAERRFLMRCVREACDPCYDEDLMEPSYRKRLQGKRPPNITWGHCYIASEALYHMWAKARGFRPYYIKYRYNVPGGPYESWLHRGQIKPHRTVLTHWYLMNRAGVVLDPTASQFGSYPNAWRPDYKNGTCCGFQQMKKETKILMGRITHLMVCFKNRRHEKWAKQEEARLNRAAYESMESANEFPEDTGEPTLR